MSDLRLRKEVDDCQPYIAGQTEANVLKRYNLEKVVKLGSNENPFAPYENERLAMLESLSYLNRYPEDDYVDLTQIIADKNAISFENVALGSGAGNVIETTARLLLDEGDEVLIAKPTYRLYREVSRLMGASVKTVPVQSDFSYDLKAMKNAITAKTKAIWLCNPNNPTGVINNPREIEKFIEDVADDVWVIVDEAYADFIETDLRPELLSRIDSKKVIVIRTFSKFYGLAGARVGYIIANQAVIKAYNTITEPFCVNRTGLFAAQAALTKDQARAKEVKEIILAQKEDIGIQLQELGFQVIPSGANFIFAKLPEPFLALSFCEALMAKGIIIRECDAWGYPEYVRITIGKKAENQAMLTEIKNIVSKVIS
ncbi:histidinol-phosphate transaminase [Ligilactobacillus sp. WILCCON 0076]|uniref:Histidinol-phosphate aminotransferase n=1 Tax=Ligilactobacillus ubinensis TaxID=2876789 RepID=A0A9X2JLF7_9LACO|nr:histidinol-phosphate transaminase [Ligilactobacillus ubinensis]MCP0886560.1 histidinol-phosphate transaminase [Ligilactobacillus ubinensis]